MRALTFAAVSLFVLCGAATAADLSRPPVYKAPGEPAPYMGWTGFYIGLNVGGGLGHGRSDFGVAGGPVFATVNNNLSGAIGGVQAGFNWQTGPTVVGFETDFQASGLKGTLTAPCLPGFCGLPLTASYTQKLPWFGTVRGRLGVASNGWLIYATGGYAYARLDTDAVATAGPAASVSLHETRNGWTAGGGIEVALAQGWSAKLEYLYFDFGRTNTTWTLGGGLPALTDDAHFTMNVVRAGLNYRF